MTNPHTERHAIRIRAQESGWPVFTVTPTSDRFRNANTEIVVVYYPDDGVKQAKLFDLKVVRTDEDVPLVTSLTGVLNWFESVSVP